jgi:hypothetical protein
MRRRPEGRKKEEGRRRKDEGRRMKDEGRRGGTKTVG